MKLQKITKQSDGARRSYDDACASAHALDLIGERWALLVVRELMMGPRRFSDLRASLPSISANVLTQRLEGLEAAGIVSKRKLPPPGPAQVYELTEWGMEAEPILLALGKWGVRSRMHDSTLPLSAVALMLSFRAKFEKARAGVLDTTLVFHFGAESFLVSVCKGALTTMRGETPAPDVAVTGTPPAVAGLVYGKVPMKALERAGALTIAGDRSALQRFAALWEMPPKAGASA